MKIAAAPEQRIQILALPYLEPSTDICKTWRNKLDRYFDLQSRPKNAEVRFA